jgi:hypothetical protein
MLMVFTGLGFYRQFFLISSKTTFFSNIRLGGFGRSLRHEFITLIILDVYPF